MLFQLSIYLLLQASLKGINFVLGKHVVKQVS